MGIFNFFKTKKKSRIKKKGIKKDKIKKPDFTEIREKENFPEKVDFSEIEDFINRKNQINKEKENLYLDYLEKKKQEFIYNLQNRLEILRNADLEYKKPKTNHRVKLIVQQNKDKYIQHLEAGIEKLKNLEKTSIENFINKANKIFEEFHKKSYSNYEKTTVLIGKEIGEIRKLIKSFSEDLVKLFDENKPLIQEMKISSQIKSSLDQIKNIDSELNETENSLLSLQKEIEKKDKEKKGISEEIQKIKNSEKYKERLNKQKKEKDLQKQLNNSILNLKDEIDFKEMANFFHIFPEKIRTVKDYKENFSKKFKENKKELLDLLQEAGIKTSAVSEKIKEIENKEQALGEIKRDIPEDETIKEHNKLEKVKEEIENLENKKSDLEKRKNKLREGKQELINSLKSELNKLNTEIV